MDAYLRSGDEQSAKSELTKLAHEGPATQRAKAGLMLCEAKPQSEQPSCYRELNQDFSDNTDIAAVADVYALSQYRFFLSENTERRLAGLMKLSLQCSGTPAGLKAINYLKGHWASLHPQQRLEAWLKWGEQVHDLEVVRCRAESDASQVIAVVTLERAGAYIELGDFENATSLIQSIWPKLERSVWWDDVALVWATSLFKNKQPTQALDVLQMFIDRRESSFFIGSYESIYFDDALMMRGRIYESLTESLLAREAYLLLVESAPKSRLCDDASYRAAMLLPLEKRGQALARFIQDYPESKWVRVAREALE